MQPHGKIILRSGKRKQEIVPQHRVYNTSNKSSRTRVRKIFKLLDLPAELRILILEFLLVQPQPLQNMILDPGNHLISDCNYDSMIQVATTCRQLAVMTQVKTRSLGPDSQRTHLGHVRTYRAAT